MEEKITTKQAAKLYRENGGKVVDESIDGFVVLKNINKVYDNHVQAVYDFNLSIEKKEFIVLVGPSGCGKSTTLRMIAGLEEISSGYLYIDRVMANHLESKDRDIAMVFQSYALYPNMTVYDNIGFGLKVRGISKEEIRRRVFEAAEILDLGAYLDRRPRELSGGQMQRVALGRAIVRDAKLFLMDEPLSNLDAKLRVQMRSEIVKLHKNINATTVYVTHDQTEAMTMADRIVVMNKGFIQQIGTPSEIYNNPANLFVATFIGNPPMNVFVACIRDGMLAEGEHLVTLPEDFTVRYRKFMAEKCTFFEELSARAETGASDGEIAAILKQTGSGEQFVKKEVVTMPEKRSLFSRRKKAAKPDLHAENAAKLADYLARYKAATEGMPEVYIGIRPENIHLADEFRGTRSENLTVTADFVELLGSEYCIHIRLFGAELIFKAPADRAIRTGDPVTVCFDMSKVKYFDRISGENIR